jgi:hypothetical protein
VKVWWPLVLAFLVVLSGCGETKSYSQDEVERAFLRIGFDLEPVTHPYGGPLETPTSVLMAPRSREPFVVLIAETDEDAAEGYEDLRSQATSDTFQVRRGNVLATSDAGLSGAARRRVRAALASLGEPG